MSSFMFGIVVAVFASGFFFMGVYVKNENYSVEAKKHDCEQSLILRAHECKLYYLTTEEIKLIDRLGG